MQTKLSYKQNDIDVINTFMSKFFDDIQKAYRINYQSKDGKIDFIGAHNDELKDKIAELRHFGHKVLDIEFFK